MFLSFRFGQNAAQRFAGKRSRDASGLSSLCQDNVSS